MIRFLVLVVLVLIFLYGLRALALRAVERFGALFREPPSGGAARAGTPRQIGELTACPVCGVHVLTSRMIADGTARYCSEACREKAARAR